MAVETRGKLAVSMQSVSLFSGEATRLKLRHRGVKAGGRERSGLILKPGNTSICYVLGIELIDI